VNKTEETKQREMRERLASLTPEKLAYSNFLSYISLKQRDYRFSKHNLLLAKHLMKVESGEITRLMVFMPPRHGKTFLASELFPSWYMGRNPKNYIIYATYSFDRAGDVGRKVRDHFIDPVFYKIFPHSAANPDTKSANKLITNQGGVYYALGVGGAVVGRGAHCLIIDDPIKSREEADSETARAKLETWFKGVAYTRLMPGKSSIIVILTRWHYGDLAGWLLDNEQEFGQKWTVLSLPAIAETEDDLIGREIGEPLWPDAYPLENLEQIKMQIGTREWNAQYQQQPLTDDSGMVNLNWFKRYDFGQWLPIEVAWKMGARDNLPTIPFGIKEFVISWDTAFKEKELNDPSAATVWGISPTDVYLVDVINKRLGYPALRRTAIDLYEKVLRFGKPVRVLIEDRASGQSLLQDLRNSTRIPLIAINPDANKQIRMDSASPMIEAGRVWIPDRCQWLVNYETQIARFPLWREDDLVDSTSQFLRWYAQPRLKANPKLKFWK
jgi:predicted phage terminase large subunit-like protein